MNEFNRSIVKMASRSEALLRFHLGTGVRVVQQVFLPLFASFLLLYLILDPDFFHTLSAVLIGGRYFSSALPTTLFVLVMAKISAGRVVCGLTDWMGHLPIKKNTVKGMTVLAILVSLILPLSLVAFLSVVAGSKYHMEICLYLTGLPMVGLAAAFFALPVKRGFLSKLLLILACLCYSSQDRILFLAGFIFHISGVMIAGPLVSKAKSIKYSAGRTIRLAFIWRAFRLRLLIPYLLAFGIYPLLFLILANNPDDAYRENAAIRLATGMSMVIFCASFSRMLALRRPPWLWSRSLPCSSRRRVYEDTGFLIVHMSPLILIAVILRWQTMVFVFFSLPALAILSVMATRRVSANRFGVFGQIIGKSALPVFLFALWPWVAVLYLAVTPWMIRHATFLEKTLPVSQWQEISHLRTGDSQSWREN